MIGTLLFMVLGIAQAGAVDPQPINPGAWFGVEDYPPEARRAHWEGGVVGKIKVDRSGKPIECTIVESTGHEVLDDKTCAIVMERGRFHPALDEAGDPVAGDYELKMTWQIANDAGDGDAVEVGTGLLANTNMRIEVSVDKQGKMTGCRATSQGPDGDRVDMPGVCEGAAAFQGSPPIAMKDGRPVAYHAVLTETREIVVSD